MSGMKILYFFKDYPTPMYQWQHKHIIDELRHHECYVEIFNPLNYESTLSANEELISYLKKNKYDMFMTPHGHIDIFPETILDIKKLGIPTLLICFDNLIAPFMHEKNAKYFDLVWLTSKETEYLFKRWGCNTIFMPYAANPHFFKPLFEKEINRMLFIGTPYGSRKNTIMKLLYNDIDISLFGNTANSSSVPNEINKINYLKTAYNFSRFSIGRKVLLSTLKYKFNSSNELDLIHPHLIVNPPVDHSEMNYLLSNFAMSVSFTSALKTEILKNPVPIINLRSFEIPMSGGLQFCRHTKEMADYFEEDKEVLFYKNDDELISKAIFYLKPENEEIRKQMKIAARKRSENDHTWFNRFCNVFDNIGIKVK